MSVSTPAVPFVGPVVDNSRSPYAVLAPVPLNAVRLEDRFWGPRIRLNREVTLPAQLRQCQETGRIANFRRASGKIQGDFQGIFFNDSDVYKLAEAMAYSLATHPDPELDAALDGVIAEIAAAQESDGYLNTYFTFERVPERFTNLKDMHEIYCAGHLIQAAVAHHRATGKTAFLNVAQRLSDHLYDVFGPGRRVGACGHEEAEMALVELYRDTAEPRYLELAQCMIEARGRKPGIFQNSAYHQDHLPFVEQREFTGHAVRHLYFACGATDVAAERDAPGYRAALEGLWDNLTQRRMYVTGGAGSRWEGEAFGADYELPNDRAYTETCAAIGSVMWNWRMLNLTAEARYADLLETTLYNAVISGLSLDGKHYFYQNPLADRGRHRRQEWFGCACCPPNIARLLASLSGYFYSTTENTVYVHLYATGTATIPMPAGGSILLSQRTDYPWDGVVEIEILESNGGAEFLNLRVPGWAAGAKIEVNGQPYPGTDGIRPGDYAGIDISAGAGTRIRLTLPMNVEIVEAHPHVIGNLGRVAIRRGPLIYCLEQADHTGTDVGNVFLPDDVLLTPEHRPDLLNGVTVLCGEGLALDAPEEDGALYRAYRRRHLAEFQPVAITAIPYYAWANRAAGPMQVWIPVAPTQW
jgi:DUF1680 family protein